MIERIRVKLKAGEFQISRHCQRRCDGRGISFHYRSLAGSSQMVKSQDQKGENVMKESLCAQCGGKLHRHKTSLDRLVGGHLYLFENVFVQACEQCQEMWIPGSLAERMDQAIQGRLKPKRRIPVPVY